MIILGINGWLSNHYQDASAVLMKDGRVLAAVEEERITRVKSAPGQLPHKSIEAVLQMASLAFRDVDEVAFHGSTWNASTTDVLGEYLLQYFGHSPKISRFHHHDAHAASAVYASGFGDALAITVDGSGDGVSTRVYSWIQGELECLKEYKRPQSLGLFYSLITQYCGFRMYRDEYKLMGLAAYGDAQKVDLDWLLSVGDGGYLLDEKYMLSMPAGTPAPGPQQVIYSDLFVERMGRGRRTSREIEEHYKDVAAAAQRKLTQALEELVVWGIAETGLTSVCLAGGVALNCLANQKLQSLPAVNELFIQPASSDAGISLGCAYLAARRQGIAIEPLPHMFLGVSYSDTEIERALQLTGVPYSRSCDVVEATARMLCQGKVVGWFQGAAEFGPRALGNRSILANPGIAKMKEKVNRVIKFREGFRPFGASLVEEELDRFFDTRAKDAPYMILNVSAKQEAYRCIPEVIHIDGSCRVQTVKASTAPLYHQLLRRFGELTGYPVLLNTSFNLDHEPIVHEPRQAIGSFFASGLDALVVGNFIVSKNVLPDKSAIASPADLS